VEYWVLGIWTSGFLGKNSLQEKLKIGHLPLIPLFHHSSIPIFQLGRSPKAQINIPVFQYSNWGEAPKLKSIIPLPQREFSSFFLLAKTPF
jgi:hypothetical protein